jgi:hypothetical protein
VFKFEAGVDRWKPGFQEAVLDGFGFLRAYGLKAVEKNPTFVRFESKKVFVNVFHGRGSYEICIEVGLKGRIEKYGLDYRGPGDPHRKRRASGEARCFR